MAFEFGIEVLLHRPANAEIGNERPRLGHLEYPAQSLRLEDRNPAKPQSLGTSRKPQGLNCRNNRILQGLGHRLTAEATARFCRLIGKDGKMHRSIFEPLKLQPRILRAPLAIVAFERFRVGLNKARPHRFPALRGFDEHEPPGLAVPDRWSVARKFKQ